MGDALAHRRRPAGARRSPARAARAGRVHGGERQHRARRLSAPGAPRSDRQPAGQRHLRAPAPAASERRQQDRGHRPPTKRREVGVDPREVAAVLYASTGEAAPAEPGHRPRTTAWAANPDRRARAHGRRRSKPAIPDWRHRPPRGAAAGRRCWAAEQLEQVRAELVKRLAAVQAGIDAKTAGKRRRLREPRMATPLASAGSRTRAEPRGADTVRATPKRPSRAPPRPATA